jgi:hypothetical protein
LKFFVYFVSFCSKIRSTPYTRYSSELTGSPVAPDHGAWTVGEHQTLERASGLLFNFPEVKLVDGISRLVLPSAHKPRTEGNEGNEV